MFARTMRWLILFLSLKDHYDIFFVQTPHWNFIRYAPSTVSLEGDKVVGAPIHPDWTQVV